MDDLYGCDFHLEYAYEDANGGVTETDIANFDTEEPFFDGDEYEHAGWCYGEDECSC